MELVYIPAGGFLRGSAAHEPDETPVHAVTIARGYYIGKYEVTQAQWKRVMGSNPSHFKGDNLPVENISWNDCQAFVEALRKMTGKRFAMPTEAQWEYACRAGTRSEFSFGEDIGALAEHAWYFENSKHKTHPVGGKKPNAWGLHDMHGNVYEWCADWYSEGPYPDGETSDPGGPVRGWRRVLRGGGWIFVPDNLRSGDRGFSPPDYRSPEYGFRCVLLDEVDAGTDAHTHHSSPLADLSRSMMQRLEEAVSDGDRLRGEFWLSELIRGGMAEETLATWRRQLEELAALPERLTVSLPGGGEMEFILIRPGRFVMGSDTSESLLEKPAHEVAISSPYYLGKYEVTQRQWESVMSRNDSAFQGEHHKEHPVTMVSWPLCRSFLVKLSEAIPGYEFRLPTEAEWEYACRAGSDGDRHFAEGPLADWAWYGANAGGRTHPVGTKKSNAWGLHDMYGNVWEWCEDRFGAYPPEAVIDPVNRTGAHSRGSRIVRGGGWNNQAGYVSSIFRHDVNPTERTAYYGFRCAAVPKRIRPR